MNRAVVLLSGGQDSTTVLYKTLRDYDQVDAVSFDYGQRHAVELELASQTAAKNMIPWTIIPVEGLKKLGAASLTNDEIPNTERGATAPGGWHSDHALPPSFVPGRNMLFFTLAAAYAIPKYIDTIVTGVCATDHAGYPDCRAEFVGAAEVAIRLAMDTPSFSIDAPLLNLTKAQTWQLADDLGVLGEIVMNTNTCYEGNRHDAHPWGFGCGVCGACTERALGWEEFQAADRIPA